MEGRSDHDSSFICNSIDSGGLAVACVFPRHRRLAQGIAKQAIRLTSAFNANPEFRCCLFTRFYSAPTSASGFVFVQPVNVDTPLPCFDATTQQPFFFCVCLFVSFRFFADSFAQTNTFPSPPPSKPEAQSNAS